MKRQSSAGGILLLAALFLGPVVLHASPRYVEFILDASGSMKGSLDGKQSKMSEAKKFLTAIFQDMSKWNNPPFVAIRVFGNAPSKKKDCEDSQLALKFGPVPKPEELQKVLDGIRPKGNTPLAYTVDLAQQDFPKDIRQREIYLITDGKESCGGNVPDVVKSHRANGKDISLYIVALSLPSEDEAALQSMAKEAGGQMWSVNSTDGLRSMAQQLSASLQMPTTLNNISLPSLTPGKLSAPPAAKKPEEKTIVDAPKEKPADVVVVPRTVQPSQLNPPKILTDDPHPVTLAKDKRRGRALRAGLLSLAVPGLGQFAHGERLRGAATFVGEGGLVAAAVIVSDRVAKEVDRQMRDQYQYQFIRFGAGAEWMSQAAGTVVRFWPHDPPRVSPGKAALQSMVVPGWGLWSCGYYETAFNVLAWEGFLGWWATRGVWINPEHYNGERLQLRAFNIAALMVVHGAQVMMAASAARSLSRKTDPGTLSFDVAPGRLGLRWTRRFGKNAA